MTQSALAELLSAWLPAQRWFAGSGARVRRVEITSQVLLAAGDPELRHLMADVWLGEEKVSYQVPIGIRPELPPSLSDAAIGALPDGKFAYDAARDPELTSVLLRGIAAAGPLRFAAGPGAVVDETAVGRTLPALASNTSIVFGDKAILKLLRRPFTGHHPDLEVPAALSRSGSRLVAPPLGWIEIAATGQGMPVHPTPADSAAAGPTSADPTSAEPTAADPTVLAILSVYFAHSTDAWTLATANLQAAGPDFSGESRLLGEATARLHAEMAIAFGASMLPRPALADLVHAMSTELTQAIKVVASLREHEAAVRACYARLAEPGTEVAVQRIHGDYHLAQVLGTDGGWVVLDFEVEDSLSLASRRAFAPALRDVAGMLRSFDYAARHQALRHPGDQRLAQVASDWVRHCQDAFCTGYAELTGTDPRHSGPLLRALTLQKAVYEAVYEARHRPDWLPIPLGAIAEATYDSRS